MYIFDFGADAGQVLSAIGQGCALVQFDPSGRLLTANKGFCEAFGYGLVELEDKHHDMFVEQDYAASLENRMFWEKLSHGENITGEFRRIGKGGKEIWLLGSYNPVRGRQGKVLKIVTVAIDITAAKVQALEDKGKLDAICATSPLSNTHQTARFSPRTRIC